MIVIKDTACIPITLVCIDVPPAKLQKAIGAPLIALAPLSVLRTVGQPGDGLFGEDPSSHERSHQFMEPGLTIQDPNPHFRCLCKTQRRSVRDRKEKEGRTDLTRRCCQTLAGRGDGKSLPLDVICRILIQSLPRHIDDMFVFNLGKEDQTVTTQGICEIVTPLELVVKPGRGIPGDVNDLAYCGGLGTGDPKRPVCGE